MALDQDGLHRGQPKADGHRAGDSKPRAPDAGLSRSARETALSNARLCATLRDMASEPRAMSTLPQWPPGTVLTLVTGGREPHAIPVSAAVRAGPLRLLIGLARGRESLARL